MADAMRSERPWSTAAHTDTENSKIIVVNKIQYAIDRKREGCTLPGLDLWILNALEVTRDVLDVSLSLLVVPHFAPQSAGLLKIDCRRRRIVSHQPNNRINGRLRSVTSVKSLQAPPTKASWRARRS